MRALSDDFRAVSADLRQLDLSQRIDRIGANVEALTSEAGEFTAKATELIQTFQGTTGPDGLMADVRRTLDNTNRAMSNMVDNTEALKRNWFFRGFFDDRGFFNIDAVSLEDYQSSRFLTDRQRITRRLDESGMFDPGDVPILTDAGRQRLDAVMAEYLRYSKEDPLMVEAYTAGSNPEDLLLARDWAVAVREYLIGEFELRPSYVGIMPMTATDFPPSDRPGDGVALVLFATRGR
jgi:phospholipid/cholesterol/gamma-HCH transport system substrate-binding protein